MADASKTRGLSLAANLSTSKAGDSDIVLLNPALLEGEEVSRGLGKSEKGCKEDDGRAYTTISGHPSTAILPVVEPVNSNIIDI